MGILKNKDFYRHTPYLYSNSLKETLRERSKTDVFLITSKKALPRDSLKKYYDDFFRESVLLMNLDQRRDSGLPTICKKLSKILQGQKKSKYSLSWQHWKISHNTVFGKSNYLNNITTIFCREHWHCWKSPLILPCTFFEKFPPSAIPSSLFCT